MLAGWFGAYHKLIWLDDGTNLHMLIQVVLQRLSDPELTIQIDASNALHFIIEIEK